MTIIIRQAEDADAQTVAELSAQLGYSITMADTLRQIVLINNSTNDVAYLAVVNDKVVGWLHAFYTLRMESAPFCEVGGLVVAEEYRGNGIGRLLLQKATQWCESKSCNRLVVRSNIKRQDAHRFYTNNGFKETKEQKILALHITVPEK